MDTAAWHRLAPEQVAARLGVDPRSGLAGSEVELRRARAGPNLLPAAPGPSVGALLLRQARSFVVLLLLAASAVSFALGQRVDAAAIFAALLLNAAVGFAMDLRAERALASLAALAAPQARVRRDGVESEVPASELVPGDVVLLEAGDRVPADGRLGAGELQAEEALLTGESLPVAKRPSALEEPQPPVAERCNELFAGTTVVSGAGTLLVTATAAATEVGRIGQLLASAPLPRSPLSERLDALGRYLLWLIVALAGLVLAIGLVQERPFWPLLETAVVVAIAAVPEGLPAVSTLALAAGAWRLARAGLLLRNLAALEALGAVTTLCLDKTGTLTANALTVRRLEVPGHAVEVSGEAWVPEGAFLEEGRPASAGAVAGLQALLRAGQLCNDATLESHGEGWHVHGDPSEGALLVAAAKAGVADARNSHERVRALPPMSGRPWMLVVLREGDAAVAYMKGAPEQVLARCEAVAGADGARAFEPGEQQAWRERNRALAGRALRVLGFAMRPLGDRFGEEDLERGWRWLGLAGMADQPRPGVEQVLAAAHRAGIRTLMITGDQRATAAAIAKELELAGAGKEPRVAVGSEALAPEVDVYARASPEGKLRLVQALQADGQLAAMTGDGVNDAPALRAAAVGVAMGGGAQVAKEAADAVLVDEQLATLLAGVQEGRTVFLNIQKALDFLLTCSMTTLLTVLLATAAGLPLPLLPLQILYLNLLLHTFPALGLTLEPASPRVMERPPLPRRAALLPGSRSASILMHSLIIATATLTVGGWGLGHGGLAHGHTLVFATVASALLVHALSDRSARPFGGLRAPGSNRILWVFLGTAIALQLAAIYLAPLAQVLGLTGLNRWDWLFVGVAALTSFLATETSKWVLPPG